MKIQKCKKALLIYPIEVFYFYLLYYLVLMVRICRIIRHVAKVLLYCTKGIHQRKPLSPILSLSFQITPGPALTLHLFFHCPSPGFLWPSSFPLAIWRPTKGNSSNVVVGSSEKVSYPVPSSFLDYHVDWHCGRLPV